MSSITALPGTQASLVVRAVHTWARDLRVGGSLLFTAGSVILLGIITAEALYTGPYSTGGSQISDLGGTEPPGSVVLQPAATIFDVSMTAVGLFVLVATILVHRVLRRPSLTIPLALLGTGALGVGIFPGNTGSPHAIFAMTTFISGGVAAIMGGRIASGPFRYLSIALGAIALLTLASYIALGEASPMAGLGIGGLERWIVYPIVLWVTGFGAYLAGLGDGERSGPSTAGRA